MQADRSPYAENLWHLATVACMRAFEGPAAARQPHDNAPTGPFQALPIGAQARRAGQDGNLLADLFTARARTRIQAHVRPPVFQCVTR